MTLSIDSAGFQTTVQDRGRFGFRELGVTTAGALDPVSLRLTNLLVGNDEDAAGLELTSGRVRLRFADERLIAWAGGEFVVGVADEKIPPLHCARIAAGEILELRPARAGRAWLAITGGINVAPVLGSRSTDLRAQFGGFNGRALCDGDHLPLGRAAPHSLRVVRELEGRVSPWAAPDLRRAREALQVIGGKQWEEFDGETRERFVSTSFRVMMNSDRMGLRLEPAALKSLAREPVSEAVTWGTIQVPGSGAPIVLLADCQTVGGYPKIAHIITVDLPYLAQLQPLDEVRFELISLERARRLLRERERTLARFRAGLQSRFR